LSSYWNIKQPPSQIQYLDQQKQQQRFQGRTLSKSDINLPLLTSHYKISEQAFKGLNKTTKKAMIVHFQEALQVNRVRKEKNRIKQVDVDDQSASFLAKLDKSPSH